MGKQTAKVAGQRTNPPPLLRMTETCGRGKRESHQQPRYRVSSGPSDAPSQFNRRAKNEKVSFFVAEGWKENEGRGWIATERGGGVRRGALGVCVGWGGGGLFMTALRLTFPLRASHGSRECPQPEETAEKAQHRPTPPTHRGRSDIPAAPQRRRATRRRSSEH